MPQALQWTGNLYNQIVGIFLDGNALSGISDDVLLELIALIVGTLIAFAIGFLAQLANNKRLLRRFLARDLEFSFQELRRFGDAEPQHRQSIREDAVSKLRRDFGDAKAQQILSKRADKEVTVFELQLEEFMSNYHEGTNITKAMRDAWAALTDQFVKTLDAIDSRRKASHAARGKVWRNLRGNGNASDGGAPAA